MDATLPRRASGLEISRARGYAIAQHGSCASTVAESDCARACNLVDECTSELTDDCMSRCMNSLIYDEQEGSRCLSQRIFWIDEDGRSPILGTYDGFEREDTGH